MIKEKFYLKNTLLSFHKVELISSQIYQVDPKFDKTKFLKETKTLFEGLELKQRVEHVAKMLYIYLPKKFEVATDILIKSLPSILDPQKKDNDFGEFIYCSYSKYISMFGCEDRYLKISLNALEQITMRFSAEFEIRDFINKYPKQTLDFLNKCSKSKNYHVRRLSSESSRPKLPWAKKIDISYKVPLSILNRLFYDDTRYVTRSVANHLNDISKIDPTLVINTLDRWKRSNLQNEKEMKYIIKHSLRTLIKKGLAMKFLGFDPEHSVELNNFNFKNDSINIGEYLEFSFDLDSKNSEPIIVDYIIHFVSSNSKLSKKTYKLKEFTLTKSQTVHKKHLFKKNMTTRKLYEGQHKIQIQINGKIAFSGYFQLKH